MARRGRTLRVGANVRPGRVRRIALAWAALVGCVLLAAPGGAQEDPAPEPPPLLREARDALDEARATPGFATPDVPVWDRALSAAREADAELAGGPFETEAVRVLARTYQGVGWWSRAAETWARLETRLGELEGEDLAMWREARMQLAYAGYEAGRFDAAASHLADVLAALPNDAEALRWRGRIALERGSPAQAETYYARLLELRPDDEGARHQLTLARERARRGRGASDAFRAGLAAYDSGDLSEAAGAFARALEAAPDWVAPARWRARTLLEAGRSEEAVAAWNALAERYPGDEEIAWLAERARLQARVGAEALRAADEARNATEAGDMAAAADAWARATAAAPGWLDARVGLGRAAFAAGEIDRARAAWQEVLARTEAGRPLGAEARTALERTDVMRTLGLELGRAYVEALNAYERGDAEEAAAGLRRVVERAPEYAPAWATLGRLAFARGDWRQAAEAYGRAAELEPANQDYAYFAREARTRAGDREPSRDRANDGSGASDVP